MRLLPLPESEVEVLPLLLPAEFPLPAELSEPEPLPLPPPPSYPLPEPLTLEVPEPDSPGLEPLLVAAGLELAASPLSSLRVSPRGLPRMPVLLAMGAAVMLRARVRVRRRFGRSILRVVRG